MGELVDLEVEHTQHQDSNNRSPDRMQGSAYKATVSFISDRPATHPPLNHSEQQDTGKVLACATAQSAVSAVQQAEEEAFSMADRVAHLRSPEGVGEGVGQRSREHAHTGVGWKNSRRLC